MAVRAKDVAARAGVSVQTVYNVVNEREAEYSDETRSRVMAAVEQLGYLPDRAARSLRTRRHMQIGYHLAVPQFTSGNMFALESLREIVSAANRVGHQIVVHAEPDFDPRQFAGLAQALGVDGFILVDGADDDPRPRLLTEAGVPFAAFGRIAPELPQAWVDTENEMSMRHIVQHLLDRGHTQFAYLGEDDTHFWNRARRAGANEALAAAGHAIPPALNIVTTLRRAAHDFEACASAATAFICECDAIAVAVTGRAAQLGLQAGRDIAVTGFDGSSLAWPMHPTLTTQRYRIREIAEHLLAQFVAVTEGRPPRAGVLIPPDFTIGTSTGITRDSGP